MERTQHDKQNMNTDRTIPVSLKEDTQQAQYNNFMCYYRSTSQELHTKAEEHARITDNKFSWWRDKSRRRDDDDVIDRNREKQNW